MMPENEKGAEGLLFMVEEREIVRSRTLKVLIAVVLLVTLLLVAGLLANGTHAKSEGKEGIMQIEPKVLNA